MNDYSQPPPTPEPNEGNQGMGAQPATLSRKDPKWSIRSLMIPVIFIIIYLLLVFIGGNAGLLLIFVLPAYVFLFGLGVVFAIRSLTRKERFKSLSWLALLLNAAPFLLLIFGILKAVLFFFG
jgi:uncharacterized membrane protein